MVICIQETFIIYTLHAAEFCILKISSNIYLLKFEITSQWILVKPNHYNHLNLQYRILKINDFIHGNGYFLNNREMSQKLGITCIYILQN